MRVYVDTSVYNRPFDDQRQPRIWLEALALGVILQTIAAGEAESINSTVLQYENDRNPFPLRKQWVNRCLGLFVHFQAVDEDIRQRAQELERNGIAPVDALHVASAETALADYFLTCDDRLLRRYRGNVKVLNPVDFVLATAGGN